jgi:FAD/FMN-containing dehydrogenase
MREGLYAIVGSAGVGECSDAYQIDDAAPCAVVMPETEAEVCALMEYARGMRAPCIVAGSGTHLPYLTPHEKAWWLLSTQRLNRIIDYSPHDLVLTVGAGMTLQAVQDVLREHHQYLPWNPALPQQATIGGIVASNRAGSWRYRFGTPRDRLLAVRAVRTDGVAFKSGAKVVKSVAGYDLHRLLCGSWGTLAVITEITLKVQPLPQAVEAVGWFTTWQELEPTLADLMRMPIQPDGISVLALRGGASLNLSGLRAVSQVEWGGIQSGAISTSVRYETPEGFAGGDAFFEVSRCAWNDQLGPSQKPLSFRAQRGTSAVLTEIPTRGRVELLEPLTLPETEERLQLQADSGTPSPFILLEFSGRPEGVAWQIQRLREQGYPAKPVSEAQLRQVQDWLAPRRHALMIQMLLRPSDLAEQMACWAELQGVSMVAHAGSGVLYIAVDETGLSDALIQRIRTLEAKYRVLSGAAWLRHRTDGELPRVRLSEGERRLMQRIKHALDEKGILPALI